VKSYEIRSPDGVDALALVERSQPEPRAGQVLVRMRASSINYRDLSTIEDPVSRKLPYPTVPNSDGAGEVVAIGPGVTRFDVGDRVAGTFFQRWIAGGITADAMASALGGAIDGVMSEYVVFDEGGLVAIPDHLSFEEGATLPCAALTAWHALIVKGGIKAGDTVLLLGTGGVSIFALQFGVMHGVRAIVTSSSDAKLARAREMGAWETINYRDTPDWQDAVRAMTAGRGVDQVIEVGGPGTLERSIQSVRVGGRISLIGILTGVAGQVNPTPIMRNSITVDGIYVGSRDMFEDMNEAISANSLKPVIDTAFPFTEARAAYHRMRAGGHFGKIVVSIGDQP